MDDLGQPHTGTVWPPPVTPPESGDDGDPSPGPQPVIDSAKLGVLLFVAAETMLFAGFIAAFLVFRLGAPVWPPPFQPRLPVGVTGVNTVVLLASGYTMYRALRRLSRGERAGAKRDLTWTAILGAAFLLVQGYEWARLIEFGLTVTSGVYGGTFYALIGAHAFHVLGALICLVTMLVKATRARLSACALPAFGIFWYFVVGLWPLLYLLVYLA